MLAAGSARRFGATKQLQEVDGRPLVAHAVAAATAAGLSPVLVVVGHDGSAVGAAAAIAGPVTVVDNADHGSGQASSLRAGIDVVRRSAAAGVVVLLADEPDVSAAAVAAVAAELTEVQPVVRARYRDGAGHPVGFHRAVFARLLEVEGDEGARGLLRAGPVAHVAVDGPRPRDVDTPADLARRRGSEPGGDAR